MKILKISFLALAVGSLLFFSNCKKGGGKDEPSEKELKTEILINNSPWTIAAAADISLPTEATDAEDWVGFEVKFTSSTQMTTSGHATGAGNVWPSGGWTANDNVTEITRAADNVKMTVQTLNENTLKVSFNIEDEELGGARTASLDGNYVFTLTSGN